MIKHAFLSILVGSGVILAIGLLFAIVVELQERIEKRFPKVKTPPPLWFSVTWLVFFLFWGAYIIGSAILHG